MIFCPDRFKDISFIIPLQLKFIVFRYNFIPKRKCAIVLTEQLFYVQEGRTRMKSKRIFKLGSTMFLIFFYVVLLFSLLSMLEKVSYLWWPESGLAAFFGPFDPIYSMFTIQFNEHPTLYQDSGFISLALLCDVMMGVFGGLFCWYMHRLLKNIFLDSLFTYKNVGVLFKLGIVSIVPGSAFVLLDNLLAQKALALLTITNATMTFTDVTYLESISSGVVLLFISLALKQAVHAVEENKQTI
ncbi:DUF2975 family protein [Aureibacillus halotolerans]|uniref:DUF2975 family protein n=2 Tax=Aureibacillus halotolerans TaxID=1508390 RepID=A0A4R6UCI1_9BACI|nr:DUF2975 family protein [Aureibacillus halotolerans]